MIIYQSLNFILQKNIKTDPLVGLERSEIDATADRNVAIIQTMVSKMSNRAILGNTETMPAWLPVLQIMFHCV